VKDSTGILRDLIKDSNWNFAPGDLVSFFNELDIRQGTLLTFLVSFFNELDTRQGTMLPPFVSFFNEVDTRPGTILMNPCFIFNEVDTRKELSSSPLVSFFNEVDIRQGTRLMTLVHGPYKNMAPKRSSLDERTTLWEEYMSFGTKDRSDCSAPST